MRKLLAALASLLLSAAAARAQAPVTPAMQAVLDYAQSQNTTGFLVVDHGRPVVERNWTPAAAPPGFGAMLHGKAADGALLEDVASAQKSVVAVLIAIAVDKGLIDVSRPVSSYIGPGWSKATPDQEGRITVLNLLNMNTGLTEQFTYATEPGRAFFYNTPVYAVTKRVVAAAARRPLEDITRDWLTAPLGMADSGWRTRPAALADVGNPTGFITTPRDLAKFGQMILDGGVAPGGRRVISQPALASLFERSATNPAYGRLWWLNGSPYAIKPLMRRVETPLIPAAPSDLVAALGALDRKLYVSPSRGLVVVRLGAAAADKDFDQQLWLRLSAALQPPQEKAVTRSLQGDSRGWTQSPYMHQAWERLRVACSAGCAKADAATFERDMIALMRQLAPT